MVCSASGDERSLERREGAERERDQEEQSTEHDGDGCGIGGAGGQYESHAPAGRLSTEGGAPQGPLRCGMTHFRYVQRLADQPADAL